MMDAYVHGIGIATPGLPDWTTATEVLRGERPFSPEPLPPHQTNLLPRNEARRAGAAVRLAFRAAEQACSGLVASDYASVFASASGDIEIAHCLARDLVDPARAISPTQFHNSVHNAASGYWSIATGARAEANSVSAHLDSFAVALQEAWALMATEHLPVLLVCFELEGGELLQQARPSVLAPCAVALALGPCKQGAVAQIGRPRRVSQAATSLIDSHLDCLRLCNAAARGLPLLTALAMTRGCATPIIASSQGNLAVACEVL